MGFLGHSLLCWDVPFWILFKNFISWLLQKNKKKDSDKGVCGPSYFDRALVFILQSVIHLESLIKRHLPVVQSICSNQFKWQMLTWPFHEGTMSITGELVFHIEMEFLNLLKVWKLHRMFLKILKRRQGRKMLSTPNYCA